MSVSVSPFGQLHNGQPVLCITMTNDSNTSVSVLDYGATVQSFIFDGVDVVLGYDDAAGYEKGTCFFGATIGRYANRIASGRFTLNGEEFQLACNETERDCHLHGGVQGFDRKIWNYIVLEDESEPSVRFSLVSEDGEENYPGRLLVSVTFTLTRDNELKIRYEAISDKDTIVNLTNHSYFNLNGFDGVNVLDTRLKLAANEYTPVDAGLIPTGEYATVSNTPFDFTKAKAIGEAVLADHPHITAVCGIDHNFVLSHEKRQMTDVAWAYSSLTGIRLVCSTDLPGLQIYTGNSMCEKNTKSGVPAEQYQGFCLETQFFPDSINKTQFSSPVLKAGETFISCTSYRLDKQPLE